MSDAVEQSSCRILFFGHLPGITGCPETSLAPAAGETVASLLERLYLQWPALREADASLRVAVNLEYAERGDAVPAGAEVAVMPPVQGG